MPGEISSKDEVLRAVYPGSDLSRYRIMASYVLIKDRQGVSGWCAALGHINPQLWWL